MDHKDMNRNRNVNKEANAELAKQRIHAEEKKENAERERQLKHSKHK